jgi:hypothetical protein
MSDWIRRLHASRTARNVTLGALGLLILGSSGGALLANYTVAGMNPMYLRGGPPKLAAYERGEGLVRDVRLEDWGVEIPSAGTSSEAVPAEYSDASY